MTKIAAFFGANNIPTQVQSVTSSLQNNLSAIFDTIKTTTSSTQDDNAILQALDAAVEEQAFSKGKSPSGKGLTSSEKTSKQAVATLTGDDRGYIVTSINSQEIISEELGVLSASDVARIGKNGHSTTLAGSDDVIRGKISEALSTQNVHTCACLVLYNEAQDIQVMYHVFSGTQYSEEISEVITQVMPEGFNKAVVIPGDSPATESTVEKIYTAITELNPETEISFMHTGGDNEIDIPAIVSYYGNVYQTQAQDTDTLFETRENINPNPSPYADTPGKIHKNTLNSANQG